MSSRLNIMLKWATRACRMAPVTTKNAQEGVGIVPKRMRNTGPNGASSPFTSEPVSPLERDLRRPSKSVLGAPPKRRWKTPTRTAMAMDSDYDRGFQALPSRTRTHRYLSSAWCSSEHADAVDGCTRVGCRSDADGAQGGRAID